MATYENRGDKWRAKVRIGDVSDSGTFATKAQAKAWAGERELELRTGSRKAATGAHTLVDALTRYAVEVSPTKRGERWEVIRLAKLGRDIEFARQRLDRIGPEQWAAWRDARLKQVSPGAVLREMGLLSAVLTTAIRDWRWISTNAIHGITKPPQTRARTRLLSDDERERLMMSLGYELGAIPVSKSQQVAWALLFALETAMRAGEICGLMRSDVRLADRVARLPMTKNGEAREVPLSTAAVALLDQAIKVPAGEDGRVLSLTVASLDALFRKACQRCQIEGLHFHDSRATALTRMARLVDVMTLSKISGHRDVSLLVRVYYREAASSIAQRLG